MRARGATDNYRRLEEEQIAVRKELRELAAAQRETSRQLDNFRRALVMATPSGASISTELRAGPLLHDPGVNNAGRPRLFPLVYKNNLV